jgi:hypothetical protein
MYIIVVIQTFDMSQRRAIAGARPSSGSHQRFYYLCDWTAMHLTQTASVSSSAVTVVTIPEC